VYNPTYVREIIQFLIKNRGLVHSNGNLATPSPRVLIIDEINRGNVSQIFGELITLLEEDKREGHDETIAVVLPYSREVFRVPANVYIIGTMNTADRGVEALDTALRRRFSFRELPPRPGVISTHGKLAATGGILEGIDLALVLQTLNDRMEVLLNADNRIGHSYFLKVHDEPTLMEAFYQHIIPLLQEYFYGHPGKLGLVLGKGFVHVRFHESAAPVQFAAFDYEDVDALQRVVYELADPATLDIIQAVKILLNAA
jgi:5-methylcytosine-specific restriction protein B